MCKSVLAVEIHFETSCDGLINVTVDDCIANRSEWNGVRLFLTHGFYKLAFIFREVIHLQTV